MRSSTAPFTHLGRTDEQGECPDPLTFAEIPLLRGKSDAMKRALLTTIAVFPEGRVEL